MQSVRMMPDQVTDFPHALSTSLQARALLPTCQPTGLCHNQSNTCYLQCVSSYDLLLVTDYVFPEKPS